MLIFKLFILTITFIVANSYTLDPKCIECIKKSFGQHESRPCKETGCGPFAMTKPYWIDAEKPTVAGLEPTFENCAKNYECSVQSMNNYMERFQKDCNNDGEIDCLDYLAIHVNGPYSCENEVSDAHTNGFRKCYSQVDIFARIGE